MATPSSAYAVDTTTTLANGTELKWTRQIKTIYPNLNDRLDRSCTYSEMSSPVFSKSGYGFKQNLLTDQYAPAYGANLNNSRWAKGFLRTDGWTKNCWYGTVLTDTTANASNVKRYFFGYTDSSGSIINGVNGGNARILRDIKVNKLLFDVTIKGYKISDYNAIDYTANPFSSQAPSEVTIKLSELDAHPNDYIVTMIYYGNTKVYGPDGAQKWLGSSISPAFICYSSDVGGFHWIPFAVPTPVFSYSYQTQNGHPSWTGGTGASVPFNLAYNYVFGCDNSSMKFELPDTFAHIDASLQALALAQYGYEGSWNHVVYYNKKIHSFGDFRCIELNYGYVSHSGGNPGSTATTSAQTNLMLGITGDAANKMIAGLGLYFCDGEEFDPNDENITPDTMYTSQHIWLGEMSGHGITTGRWIKGSDIENYTGPNKNGVINDPDYTPGSGGGGDDDDFDDHTMGAGTGISGICNLWLLTAGQLADLHSAINDDAPPGFDPLNSFISVMGLGVAPIYLTSDIETQAAIKIKQSDGTAWDTGVSGHIVASQVSAFQFTGITIDRKYNNFLDYSPYATHEIFIPMCGWLTLPDIAVDRTMTVTYLPDIESLKCRAVVSVVDNSGNRCVIGEKDGIMGAEVPFTNIGHSLFVGDAIVNGASIAGEVITGAIGAGFTKMNAQGGTYRPYEGFTVGMAGTLPGALANAFVSGNVNRTHYTTGNGTRVGFSDGSRIQVKSIYHRIDKPDNYEHTVGKVCNKTGMLSNFSGFTVCENPHVKFSALEAEKEEIKRLLEQGVIL